MSRERLVGAIGARSAVRLSRRCGGAPIYVQQATPNYAEFTDGEVERMLSLYCAGYLNIEIAIILGRSVGAIGPKISAAKRERKIPYLPKPQSREGRELRARLRAEGAGAVA